jgi:ring-1,2-phenylacetyl-CoA epoxidase subunit PaaD
MVITEQHITEILKEVTDPEIPVLTIGDMGIVKKIEVEDDLVKITITPTYSGCPAMDMIKVNIMAALEDHGINNVEIDLVISPPWTTDWISEEGKKKLKAYGIAPPVGSVDKKNLMLEDIIVPCPLCESENTEMVSQFGSTPCKSLYRCKDCFEPYDYFKCH